MLAVVMDELHLPAGVCNFVFGTGPDVGAPLTQHPKVLRVVALSGGFSTDDACARLAKNPGMIASFSRGLLQDLRKGQSDDEFDAVLGKAIDQIASASCSG